jgi:hypothetical protein
MSSEGTLQHPHLFQKKILFSNKFILTTCLASLLLLGGCAQQELESSTLLWHEPQVSASCYEQSDPVTRYYDLPDPTNRHVAALLDLYVHDWAGTPYRRGGLSRNGIDCSGFTMQTYQDVFGKNLPRTTEEQLEAGKKISQNGLKPGDLVFFKTGIRQRHVGIYLSNSQFIHASATRGVTISDLDHGYWHDHFWQARRVSTRY